MRFVLAEIDSPSSQSCPAPSSKPPTTTAHPVAPLLPSPPLFAPKVKRVIYLHMLGAPSTLDLFHYKPELAKYDGKTSEKKIVFAQSVLKLGLW